MIDRPLMTNVADNEREKATADGVESFVPDVAQQLSAWACVTTLSEPVRGSVDPCIGQSLPEQQAIRASGEACQPAHSAHPAAASVRATTKAAVRLSSSSTLLGCIGATLVSIQWGTVAQECSVARGAAVRAWNTMDSAKLLAPMAVPAVLPDRRQIAGPDSRVRSHRATPASCLCMSAAAVASLASSLDSLTKLSQCTAAWAIFVPR